MLIFLACSISLCSRLALICLSGLFRSLADTFEHPSLARAEVASAELQSAPVDSGLSLNVHPHSENEQLHGQLPACADGGATSIVVTMAQQPASRVENCGGLELQVVDVEGVGTPAQGDPPALPSDAGSVVLANMCAARTPPLSPTHVLLESDNQWLTSEVRTTLDIKHQLPLHSSRKNQRFFFLLYFFLSIVQMYTSPHVACPRASTCVLSMDYG